MSVIHGSYFPSNFSAKLSNYKRTTTKQPPVPLFISTNASDINPFHLRDLYSQCNHSPHRFPVRDFDNRVELADVNKLSIALNNSTVVVSVFTKPEFDLSEKEDEGLEGGGDWLQRMMPLSPANGRLIGFGRAVSDFCLTASIYDVMVIPTLQRRGIGRRIIQKIIRSLTNRGIYDIAALCSEEERSFFKTCGFDNDIMGSTTMMYTRTSSTFQTSQMVQCAGRKLLLLPPDRKPFQS
ncbi:Glucosamine 6-phosphate N-acetyltransferase [Heracleum sosnowskyi]|uniref:Glucosamine 6-phosphate N-acetyltransferase n=1 Tax=Heracleum sosnowskyi TaxID=360622 RepID=A0AAD8JC34_9APIA|nr:Glucosamine 6-phosphate N-acetyltransferase [Heracleum sosnowskyi]